MDYLGRKKAKDVETFDLENITKRLELLEEVVFGLGHGILKRVEVIESSLASNDENISTKSEAKENEEVKNEISETPL